MYDYAHTLSDAIEGTTHSLCTLEFEDHRPLYDWFLDQLWQGQPSRPRQIEFSRANLMFTVTSKRKLKQLVDDKHVEGWDDPRMPTLAGIRRRGYTPESIVEFVRRIGTTKKEKVAELGQLEGCVREDLNETRAAPLCRARSAEDRHRDLPGRQRGVARGRKPSEQARAWGPQGAVRAARS